MNDSVDLIVDKAKEFADMPVVFTADMNVRQDGENYNQFVNSGIFKDTKKLAPDTMNYCTYHDTKPEEHEKDIIDCGNKVYNSETKEYNKELLKLEDKWILNKLDKLINDVTNNINNYELGIALDNIYSFIWNEFCDWYIEIVKPRLYNKGVNLMLKFSILKMH